MPLSVSADLRLSSFRESLCVTSVKIFTIDLIQIRERASFRANMLMTNCLWEYWLWILLKLTWAPDWLMRTFAVSQKNFSSRLRKSEDVSRVIRVVLRIWKQVSFTAEGKVCWTGLWGDCCVCGVGEGRGGGGGGEGESWISSRKRSFEILLSVGHQITDKSTFIDNFP